jgi:hypothetical protein
VWALAATTDSDAIVIGGHVRFTIAADGKSVRARDELSKGCLKFSRRQITGQAGTFQGLVFNNVVSLTPLETHVFANLQYQLVMYVATLDGLTWKLDGGRIKTIDMDAPEADGFAARMIAAMSEQCRIIAIKPGEDPPQYYIVGDPKIILDTERGDKFTLDVPVGHKASSLVCVRLDIVPAPNDYKVVLAGYPLYVGDKGIGRPERMGALEISGGRFRYRITDGPPLTEDLSARVAKRLDGFQRALGEKIVRLDPVPVALHGGVTRLLHTQGGTTHNPAMDVHGTILRSEINGLQVFRLEVAKPDDRR